MQLSAPKPASLLPLLTEGSKNANQKLRRESKDSELRSRNQHPPGENKKNKTKILKLIGRALQAPLCEALALIPPPLLLPPSTAVAFLPPETGGSGEGEAKCKGASPKSQVAAAPHPLTFSGSNSQPPSFLPPLLFGVSFCSRSRLALLRSAARRTRLPAAAASPHALAGGTPSRIAHPPRQRRGAGCAALLSGLSPVSTRRLSLPFQTGPFGLGRKKKGGEEKDKEESLSLSRVTFPLPSTPGMPGRGAPPAACPSAPLPALPCSGPRGGARATFPAPLIGGRGALRASSCSGGGTGLLAAGRRPPPPPARRRSSPRSPTSRTPRAPASPPAAFLRLFPALRCGAAPLPAPAPRSPRRPSNFPAAAGGCLSHCSLGTGTALGGGRAGTGAGRGPPALARRPARRVPPGARGRVSAGAAAGPHGRQRHRVPSRPKADCGAFGAGSARSRGRRCPRFADPGLPAAGGGAARPHHAPPAMPGSQHPRQAAARSATCRPLPALHPRPAPGEAQSRRQANLGQAAICRLTKSTWRSCSTSAKGREGYRGRAAGPPRPGLVRPCPLTLTRAGTMAGGQQSWHPSRLSTPQVPEGHTHCCHLGSFICYIFPGGPVQQVGPHLCSGVHSSSPWIYSARQHSQARRYTARCPEKVRYLQVVKMQPLGIKYMDSCFHMLKGKKERNSILFLLKPPSISLLIQYLIFFPGHTVFQTRFSAQS